MRHYRCYLLDLHGTIRGGQLIAAVSDADAWCKAVELLEARPFFRDVEVWEQSRRTALENSGKPCEERAAEYHGLTDITLRKLDRPDIVERLATSASSGP